MKIQEYINSPISTLKVSIKLEIILLSIDLEINLSREFITHNSSHSY